jgi:hypothetical protein
MLTGVHDRVQLLRSEERGAAARLWLPSIIAATIETTKWSASGVPLGFYEAAGAIRRRRQEVMGASSRALR